MNKKRSVTLREVMDMEECLSCECSFRRGYEHAVCELLDEIEKFSIPKQLRKKLERYADKVHNWRMSCSGFELPPGID